MIRRGGRTIRPAQNPDGTLRVVPGQSPVHDDDYVPGSESEESEAYSTGSPPRHSALAIFTGGSTLETSPSPFETDSPAAQAASPTDTASSTPVFEDMGDFLKEFATKRRDLPQHAIHVAPTFEAEPVPRQQIAFSPRPLPQPLSLEGTPSQLIDDVLPPEASSSPRELLVREFGQEWDTYATVCCKRQHSGHKAILGARLFMSISTHFRLARRNSTVLVDGIHLSMADVADWFEQALRTIENWCTIEHRRVRILNRLETVSATPDRTRWKSWLESLEGPDCVLSIAAQHQLTGFMASCEAELGMRSV
ncbi:hypothetical protein FRC12_017887 [Ceratobasidium sp. 428]|nr:hypothetical protein FRC12_017887 [Ceratobasidium sp. 428]